MKHLYESKLAYMGKENWVQVELGECVRLVNGRAYKRAEMLDSGTPLLRIQNLNKGDKWYFSDLSLPPDKYCEKGDLLYAWSATFGPYIWWGEKSIYHYHIWKIVASDCVEKKFVYYLLKEITDEIKGAARGVAMPHMTKGGMEKWPVYIPPLNEQHRIVTKIETLTARSRKAREALDAIPALLDQFRQSVLAAAFRGDLTADWREQNPDVEPAEKLFEQIRESLPIDQSRNKENDFLGSRSNKAVDGNIPKSWTLGKIKDICESSFYGPRFSKDEYTQNGIPSIRTTDMTKDGQISISEETPRLLIPEDKVDLYKVVKGDLLVTRSGSIGVMAIFKGDYLAIPSAYLIRFRFVPLMSIDYIYHYLQSPFGQSLLRLSSTAVTQ